MAKLMLVEDDNNLREIYGARLMAEGYEIVSASDGEEALALAVKEKPDLIISDVMMPKISGFDMLDILRTTPETKNTKVIMMTALSQPEDRQRGESLGADKYLVKSQVTLEDVVAAVHEILGDGPAPAGGADQNPAPPPPAQPPAKPATDAAPAAPAAPAPADNGNSNGQPNQNQKPQAPQAPTQPPAQQPDNTSQTEDKNANTNTEGGGSMPQAPDENTSPKVDGASDAPEPASRKKKVIKPINDLGQDKDKLMQMAAEEEAREAQSTPGVAIGPVGKDENKDNAGQPATSGGNADAKQQPAQSQQSPPEGDISQTLAAEKAEMEAEVKELLNNGTIDAEANAPPVEVPAEEAPADTPETGSTIAPNETPATTPTPEPETQTPTPTPEPAVQAVGPEAEATQQQPQQQPPAPAEAQQNVEEEISKQIAGMTEGKTETPPQSPAASDEQEVPLPAPQAPTDDKQPAATADEAPAPAPEEPSPETPPTSETTPEPPKTTETAPPAQQQPSDAPQGQPPQPQTEAPAAADDAAANNTDEADNKFDPNDPRNISL